MKPDDCQRQDDRREEDALVDPGPPQRSVESTARNIPIGSGDADEEEQPQQVVRERRPEAGIAREQVLILLQADEVERAEPCQSVKDHTIETRVIAQIKITKTARGMPTMRASSSLSRAVRTL